MYNNIQIYKKKQKKLITGESESRGIEKEEDQLSKIKDGLTPEIFNNLLEFAKIMTGVSDTEDEKENKEDEYDRKNEKKEAREERQEKEDIEKKKERKIVKDKAKDKASELFYNNTSMMPFNKKVDCKCIRICPRDLLAFDNVYSSLKNNAIIISRYRIYKHLILCEKEGKYMLGVPDKYMHKNVRYMERYGFKKFETCDDVELSQEKYGYWIKNL